MNIENVAGLFPLKNLDSRLMGYFINNKGEVFSTKQFAKPKKMTGSYAAGVTYYTLGVGRNQSVSRRGDELLINAKLHKDWSKETEMQSANAAPAVDGLTAEEGLKAKGFVIAQIQNGSLVFGSKPKIHLTAESAMDEVKRLAAKSPGTKIVYLKIQGGAVVDGMQWL